MNRRKGHPGEAPTDWRPSADGTVLRLRAQLLARVRAFFAERGVMEVETPLLAAATVTDPHLASLETRCRVPQGKEPRRLYLQTSPEFAMKRLLAAGSGSIYQVTKAFRDGESGRYHNPEFTLLEWYRTGFDDHRLMDEVEALLAHVGVDEVAQRVSYADAFRRYAKLDPFATPLAGLRQEACRLGASVSTADALDGDACLDLIMSRVVQPSLGAGPVFVYDYPMTQAALGRIRPGKPPLAERFELFADGVELANGYRELRDSAEQRARFEHDASRRRREGLAEVALDERLLGALDQGLPECAGVALGLDRLLMVLVGAESIDEVIAFPVARA